LFKTAVKRAPALLLMDDLHRLCPDRSHASDVQKQITSCLLSLMDNGGGSGGIDGASVFYLAASTFPDRLDAALRRPGRLEREVELSVPSPEDRSTILSHLLAACAIPVESDGEEGQVLGTAAVSSACVRRVARSCHGMVGADLLLLCKHASVIALERRQNGIGDVCVTDRDLEAAAQRVSPSALRESMVEVPEVRWEDIGGMDLLKQQLREVSPRGGRGAVILVVLLPIPLMKMSFDLTCTWQD